MYDELSYTRKYEDTTLERALTFWRGLDCSPVGLDTLTCVDYEIFDNYMVFN